MRLLHSISCLSMPAEELLATCHILRTDLEATTPNEVPSDSPTQRTLQAYLQAQDVILNQVMRGGCVGVVYLQAQDIILNQVMRGGCVGVVCTVTARRSFAFDSPMYCDQR